MGFFNRGLSKEEIAKVLKKIRKEYNDYIVTYMKPSRVKDEFENRYLFAAKYKENMTKFFQNEIQILNDIKQIEVDKKRQKEKDKILLQNRRERVLNGDFADRILKEYEDRIKAYPEIKINPESSIEVRKLYGALKEFEDKHWNSLAKYLRHATSMGRVVDHLENDLWTLVGSVNRRPAVLDKYLLLLENKNQDMQALSYAEQACMKQAAFFFNELLELYSRSSLISVPGSTVQNAYNFMNQVIFDFRLGDLRKKLSF